MTSAHTIEFLKRDVVVIGGGGAGSDVVLYYRGGVRDKTADGNGPQDSMVCKKVGPKFTPIGVWNAPLFGDGFEEPPPPP